MDDKISYYLNKIKQLISDSLGLSGTKLVNKNKLEDILCCFFAVLPSSYKAMIDINIEQEQAGMKSVNLYNNLLKSLKAKQFLSYYVINEKDVYGIIDALKKYIKQDIEMLETNK